MTSQPGYQTITIHISEKVPNILQSAAQNWMLKTQSFGYHNCKANASKSSVVMSTKFKS